MSFLRLAILLLQHQQVAAGLVGNPGAQRAGHQDHARHIGVGYLERLQGVPVGRLLDGYDVQVAPPDVQRHAPLGRRVHVQRDHWAAADRSSRNGLVVYLRLRHPGVSIVVSWYMILTTLCTGWGRDAGSVAR